MPEWGGIVLQKFWFTLESVRYARSVGQKWIPKCYRGTFGDYTASLLSCHYVTFYPSGVFNGVEG